MEEQGIAVIELQVPDRKRAAEWFCRHLFFSAEEKEDCLLLRNGNVRLILRTRTGGGSLESADPDAMCLGFQHIALETCDIRQAIQYCKEQGLRLQLSQSGGALYNGKVFGTGMEYFNILTDFGLVVEISQKLHVKKESNGPVIEGLEHIGLQVSDVMEAVRFYEKLGFCREFEPVKNHSENGPVVCCMVSAGATVIEIYSFLELTSLNKSEVPVISSLILGNSNAVLPGYAKLLYGPAGECLKLFPSQTISKPRSKANINTTGGR